MLEFFVLTHKTGENLCLRRKTNVQPAGLRKIFGIIKKIQKTVNKMVLIFVFFLRVHNTKSFISICKKKEKE